MKKYTAAFVAILVFSFTQAPAQTSHKKKSQLPFPEIPRISAELAYMKYMTGKIVLVDAMNPAVFARYHIFGAVNFSCDGYKLRERFMKMRLPYPKNTEFLVYCD